MVVNCNTVYAHSGATLRPLMVLSTVYIRFCLLNFTSWNKLTSGMYKWNGKTALKSTVSPKLNRISV